MPAASGTKEMLKIQPCEIEADGSVTVKNGPYYSAMINPAKLSYSGGIGYSTETPQGALGPEVKFRAYDTNTLKFDLVIDGTGAVPPAHRDAKQTVAQQIARLSQVVYDYQGAKHEPWRVQIVWGTFSFYGRLSSLSVDYTLFKPTGEPLRAKVALAFSGFLSAKQAARMANKSSPDLTHSITVREGDSLPLLCYRIYRDSGYYPQVARFNNLADFRDLRPGMQLQFPPLE